MCRSCSCALTNLHEFINEPLLQESFDTLNKKGASGVDAETWMDYHKQRETRIPQLLTAFKSGNYRAPNIRRVYIPKGDGKLRPLGPDAYLPLFLPLKIPYSLSNQPMVVLTNKIIVVNNADCSFHFFASLEADQGY